MRTNSIRPTMTARGWWIAGVVLLAGGMSRGALGNPGLGRWGPVIPWPQVPVSAANLADGRILTWASNHPDQFPAGFTYTYAATWDPETGIFQEAAHPSHDRGHHIMLEDGRMFSNGGHHLNPTSVFDHHTNFWTKKIQAVSRSRWYPSTGALGNGDVFTVLGTGGGNYPEVRDLMALQQPQPHLKNWSGKIANAKERFVVLSAFSQEAVLDMETQLVWERSPSTKLSTWLEAIGDCYSRIVGDRLGWRLPTIEELASLVDPTQSSPPLLPRGHPFTNVQSGGQLYWSATSLFSTPPNAFAMKPSDGTVGVNIKALREGFVWCVRGGYGHSPDVLSE